MTAPCPNPADGLVDELDALSKRYPANRFYPAARDRINTLQSERSSMEGEIADAGKREFEAGYLIAVANIMNLHDEDVIAEDVLLQLGVKRSALKRHDFSDYDLKPLRKLFREIERKEALNRGAKP